MAKLTRQKSSIVGLVGDLSNITTSISAEVTRATGVESTLQSNLNAEITRATTAEGSIQSELNTTQSGAGLGTSGSYTANGLANYITTATSLVSADNLLDTALKAEEGARISADGSIQTAIGALDSRINALGNAFNYIGGLAGGVDVPNAYDLATLPVGGKDAGDYYKVTTAGYFKVGGGATFYANVGDGLVFNTSSSVDKIDNTDSSVSGTTNEITVTGSADTGFVVSIASAFSTRLTTAEADILAEVTRATTAEGLLDTNKMAKSANLSDLANTATARTNLDVYSKLEVDTAISGLTSNASKNVTAIITAGKIVFDVAPLGGVNGICFGVIRVFGVDAGAPMAYDEVQVTLDGTDVTGKTFNVASDIAGEYDGLSASAFITYTPA